MVTESRDDWRNEQAESLLSALVSLTSTDEAAAFIRDLCTHKEVTEMARRWAIVRLLDEGSSYREIADETGVSTATVTRVSQWLHHGMGGYELMLARTKGLEQEEKKA